MAQAFVILERDRIEGPAAVGSVVSSVLRRFGARVEYQCDHAAGDHDCAVIIRSGGELLSPLTTAEREHFAGSGRNVNERLACEAIIIEAGEIRIMTKEKKEPVGKEKPKEKIIEEFEAMPLEEKLANLFRMEAVALGETLEFVINSPFKVFEKIGDVMAEFGMKIEAEAKKAAGSKPAEPAKTSAEPKAEKPKTAPRRAARNKKSADA